MAPPQDVIKLIGREGLFRIIRQNKATRRFLRRFTRSTALDRCRGLIERSKLLSVYDCERIRLEWEIQQLRWHYHLIEVWNE